jgi:hypothetical protein
MIAGEMKAFVTDHYADDNYDDFFGSKKKRAERKAKRIARRTARRKKREAARAERRKNGGSFFKDVGNVYRDIGGATVIGGIIDSFTINRDRNTNNSQAVATDIPSDYEFSVGSSVAPEEKKDDTKKFPTAVYVVGGVIVVGIIGMLVINAQKNKQLLTRV